MSSRGAVFVALEQLGRDRVVEDEAAGAHQVLGVAVVDGAVVGELVDVAAALAVDAGGMIEVDDAQDVIAEHLGIAVVHGVAPGVYWFLPTTPGWCWLAPSNCRTSSDGLSRSASWARMSSWVT